MWQTERASCGHNIQFVIVIAALFFAWFSLRRYIPCSLKRQNWRRILRRFFETDFMRRIFWNEPIRTWISKNVQVPYLANNQSKSLSSKFRITKVDSLFSHRIYSSPGAAGRVNLRLPDVRSHHAQQQQGWIPHWRWSWCRKRKNYCRYYYFQRKVHLKWKGVK